MFELIHIFAHERVAAVRSHLARFSRRWRSAPASEPSPQPPPLPRDDHWGRVTGIVAAAIAGYERVEAWHLAAADHIDTAEYTFQRMLGELAAVMPIAADGAPLRAILAEAARLEPVGPRKKAIAA
jgi:hypothetical protein